MSNENLSPEQKELLKAAKSLEEIEEIASEEGCVLSDEQLEHVVGGIDMPELPDERIDCHGFFIS